MYICWGAMAALKHFHGVDKIALDKKILEFISMIKFHRFTFNEFR